MLDANTQAIVAMAWARATGLPDDTFAGARPPERIVAPSDSGVITVIHLLGCTLLHAPEWAIDRAATFTDEGLIQVHGLLTLAKDHGPRATRVASLMYADDYLGEGAVEGARVTDDPQALRDLLTRCAPDEVDADDLVGRERLFVLLDEDDLPQAAAAYSPEQGIIADLVMVSAVDARGTGLVERVATVAMHDALDEGLVPQLRIGVDDSHDLAQSLGFERLGTIATVVVS